jgi:hypothetical protein
MLQILEETENDLVAVRATHSLTQKDYDKLLPLLNSKLDRYEQLRMYFEMEDFDGWKPRAFWEDVKFDVKHANDFKRVAMVGNKQWEDYLTQVMKPFTTADVRFFLTSRKNEAKTWVHG